MNPPLRLLRNVAFGLPLCALALGALALGALALGALALAGCGSKDAAASTTSTSSTAAPPPSNLTPEQKQAYDAAVKGSQPPTAKP